MGVYLRDKMYWMCYKLPNGEYIRKSTDTENKKVAEAIYQKQAVAIAENKHLDVKRESKLVFEELSALFLERHSKPKKKSWKTSDTVYIRRLNLFFGKIPIARITQEKIEEYFAGRQSKPIEEDRDGNKRYLKPATLNRELSCLRTMFNKAIEWGKLDRNPCARIKKLRENNQRTRFLADKEITQLLECASPKLGEAITILVNTGMRKGELGSLQWADLDFDTNQIRLGNTKSGKTRFIPMNQAVKQVLLRRRIKKESETLVFQGKEGKPWDFRLPFKQACEKAGIENFKTHDLRHTFASHLCMKGADLMTVKELLGHASLTMTQRYSHLTDRHKAEAVARLDTLSSSHVTMMSQSDKN